MIESGSGCHENVTTEVLKEKETFKRRERETELLECAVEMSVRPEQGTELRCKGVD